MDDDIWNRNEIESPCKKICIIHSEHNLCMGCFRTTTEISNWSELSKENRKAIIASLSDRAKLFKPKRRGGRIARIES